MFATFLPVEIYNRIYKNGPDVISVGSLKPGSKAEAMGDSWLLNGRFGFASGCRHADWMVSTFIMSKDGVPLVQPDGQPLVRTCLVPIRDCHIEDTWQVAGLKATGSHDVVMTNLVVPEALSSMCLIPSSIDEELSYESSPLQLRLRDLLVGSQHLVAQKRQYVTSGKLLLETDPA